MSGKVPDKSEAIIQDPNQIFCQDHWNEIIGSDPNAEASANGIEATLMMIQHALADETFYEIAFRIKNGYPPPESDEIGDNERPDNVHINKTLSECSPLCCYLDDEIFEKVKRMEPPEEMKE